MRPVAIVLAALAGAALSATAAEARDVYCYTTVMPSGDKLTRALTPPKIYITDVFQSDDDVYLISANFQATVPTGGLATCVTGDDVPDVHADWQDFLDQSKKDGVTIETVPAPTS